MQKSIAIWGSVVLIVLALGMSGCASNNDSTNKPSGSSSTTDKPAAAPSSNTPAEQPAKEGHSDQDEPQIVASNEAFRIYQPAPDSTVGQSFVVKGQARVFEAVLNYSVEDGHNILAEGFANASMGAPEWGDFTFTVKIDTPTSPTIMLSIFEASAKDGKPIHVLRIPLKFDKGAIQAK